MEIAIPVSAAIIQVTQQYAPLIATALGKYIINHHFGSYIFMYDMQKWMCSSAPINSQQALSLLSQSYATKEIFDSAMQGKTFLPGMVQTSLNSSPIVSFIPPTARAVLQATPFVPIVANNAMLSVLKSHLMQLAIKTKFALNEQPIVSSGVLSPSSVSFSVGYGLPDATLAQVRTTERLNAYFYLLEMPEKKLSVDESLVQIFNNQEHINFYGPVICMKLNEEHFNLFFFGSNSIKVRLSLPDVPKKKRYLDREFIDFDEYIRLVLDLVKDFPIEELKTDISY
jgi:hypothetical protein